MIQLTQAQIIGAIIAFLVGISIIPFVIYYSEKAGLVDVPNERKIHHGSISRLGGIAIWLSVMFTFLFLVLLSYYPKGVGLSGVIVGGSLMFLLGLIDDIFCLDAKFKLFIQIAIATIVFLLGVQINEVYIPVGHEFSLGVFAYPITVLWIVGISNAVNFIDGVDGLAGSIVAIGCIAIALVSLVLVPASSISALVAFILMGAMLSFLMFNYNPAKIFMGDSGSLFAGFMLATLSVTGIMKGGRPFMYLPFLILFVPILDVAFSSIRRILKGSSPFVADSEHIHHQLLHAGFSQNRIVVILSSIAFMASLTAFALAGSLSKYFIYTLILVMVLILLSVISKTMKKDTNE
ncbi:MAG: undecaprenyl/decaprenyl-phosphate alpha-N-acetylglucosaminyl 1-phosphate transferase [Cyanobacteria bacterium SIG30]|nr:undecaprenyl/decaprenyl-phosphate alpha-N-acetylglucosaminyl 1-phosphate transferase [Cyanobacteria bacterium SIG30]